jgi:hypothetical protein
MIKSVLDESTQKIIQTKILCPSSLSNFILMLKYASLLTKGEGKKIVLWQPFINHRHNGGGGCGEK